MKDKLRAMRSKLHAFAIVLALIALTYVVEQHPIEARVFLLHVLVVMLIDFLVASVHFSWPSSDKD